MIIEIGTSDFRTQAGQVDGIFIEPVKTYFDNLPECTKINCAISNEGSYATMFFVDPDKIKKHNLPDWLRGCNSIHEIHPTVQKMIDEGKINPTWVKSYDVEVRRIKSIIDQYNIIRIDVLKVDTEGHDVIILNDFFDTVDIKPSVVQFEYNVLTDKAPANKLIQRMSYMGYKCERVKDDIICKL